MPPRKPDPVSMLKKDHQTVKKLLNQLVKADGRSERQRLFEQIRHEITVHSRLEEEIFYPAFKESAKTGKDEELFYESNEEHALVDHLLETMAEGDFESDEFAGKARVLRELVQEHIKEEESDMFPKAKRYLGDEVEELGERMTERREELMSEIGGAAKGQPRQGGRQQEEPETAA